MKRKRDSDEVESHKTPNAKKRKIEEQKQNVKEVLEKAKRLLYFSGYNTEENVKTRNENREEAFKLISDVLKNDNNNIDALFLRANVFNINDVDDLFRANGDVEEAIKIFFEKTKNIGVMNDGQLLGNFQQIVRFLSIHDNICLNIFRHSRYVVDLNILIRVDTLLISLFKTYIVAVESTNKIIKETLDESICELYRMRYFKRGLKFFISDLIDLSLKDFLICEKLIESKKEDYINQGNEGLNKSENSEKLLKKVYYHLGVCFFRKGNYQFCEKYFTLFLKAAEDIQRILSDSEDIQRILSDFEKLKLSRAYYFRGRTFVSFNKILGAIKDFSKSKKLLEESINTNDNENIFSTDSFARDLLILRDQCVEKLKSKIFQEYNIQKF